MSISWIDVKLGVRMLVNYPGLSLVAVTGMALVLLLSAAGIYAMMSFTVARSGSDRRLAPTPAAC